MRALSNPLPILNPNANGLGEREVLGGEASSEFVFAVVGHAGSGTTAIAKTLGSHLCDTKMNCDSFEVTIIRARDVIAAWAAERGNTL